MVTKTLFGFLSCLYLSSLQWDIMLEWFWLVEPIVQNWVYVSLGLFEVNPIKKKSRRNEKKSFKKVSSLHKIILSSNKFRIFLETTLLWWKTNFIGKILSEHEVHRVKSHSFSKCASLSLVFFVFNWTRNFGLSVMEM